MRRLNILLSVVESQGLEHQSRGMFVSLCEHRLAAKASPSTHLLFDLGWRTGIATSWLAR